MGSAQEKPGSESAPTDSPQGEQEWRNLLERLREVAHRTPKNSCETLGRTSELAAQTCFEFGEDLLEGKVGLYTAISRVLSKYRRRRRTLKRNEGGRPSSLDVEIPSCERDLDPERFANQVLERLGSEEAHYFVEHYLQGVQDREIRARYGYSRRRLETFKASVFDTVDRLLRDVG